MQTYVVYDIVEDRVRKKIADTCLDYGLQRIQYSAFCGELSRDRRESLALKLARWLEKQEGRIEIVPLCDKDLAQVKRIEGKTTTKARKGTKMAKGSDQERTAEG